MSRTLAWLCASIYALPLTSLVAEEANWTTYPSQEQGATFSSPVAKDFQPFTGKVKAKKVRLRLKPDLESSVIRELNKNELLSILGESGDFYAISPPPDVKAYVFRSFVLDGVVEGSRVNVRLEPSIEAPVIGYLHAGDKVYGTVSAANGKWLEIQPTKDTRFYVAREYIDYVGGPELKAQLDKRRSQVEQLLNAATLFGKSEMRKPFEEIDMDRLAQSHRAIIDEYTDFPEWTEKAKESLLSFQELYLQKKIAFLEAKASKAFQEDVTVVFDSSSEETPNKQETKITDKMRLWEPIEESLYLTWARVNEDKDILEFYDEQMLSAEALTGIVEMYAAPVKNKPGDFILKDKDLPLAYLYSSQINLQDFVGKKVTILGAPRPNNHFAFPAFFVLSVE